ncbi:hypothetical protein KSNIM_01100 [Kitasatospora sp. DSM 101779]|nr:hypothetical protein [Kitasatospora sp. DSM 101779]
MATPTNLPDDVAARPGTLLRPRSVSDGVAFMDGGVVVESGPPEAVFGAPRSPRLRQFLSDVL